MRGKGTASADRILADPVVGTCRLPERMEEETLADLLPGETCWVVPWSLWADVDGWLWLSGDMRPHRQPHGTAAMEVTRDAFGFHVKGGAPKLTRRRGPSGHGCDPDARLPVMSVALP